MADSATARPGPTDTECAHEKGPTTSPAERGGGAFPLYLAFSRTARVRPYAAGAGDTGALSAAYAASSSATEVALRARLSLRAFALRVAAALRAASLRFVRVASSTTRTGTGAAFMRPANHSARAKPHTTSAP